ncbi:hypothetical protein V5F40_22940 [Xanthobacter sp. DSM 14520]|uniref:hypothetical protein n=1 Tax=Xanthobacter autotrophicus (strain ATCC BAA-1158 / Py2) TaxID=78245 RepID=UPI00372BFB6D
MIQKMTSPPQLNGYTLRVTPMQVEGFLAVYGDRDRYPGDDRAARKADVMLAVQRLCLVTSPDGTVTVSAHCSNPLAAPSCVGFLEVYERNSILDGRSIPLMIERLRTALSLFLARSEAAGT